MGILNFLFKNNEPVEEERNYYSSFLEGVINNKEELDKEELEKLPGVINAINIYKDEIIKRNLVLKEYDSEGNGKVINDIRVEKWNYKPNEFTKANEFRELIVEDLIYYGKAYAEIERDRNGEVKAYHYIPCKNVIKEIMIDRYGRRNGTTYKVTISKIPKDNEVFYNDSCTTREIRYFDMIEIVYGKGLVNIGATCMNLYKLVNETSKEVLKNSSTPSGILETEGRLNKDMATRLKESWEKLYTGVRNAGKTVVLEEGLKYKPIQRTAIELDLTNQQTKIIEDVERMSGFSIGTLTKPMTKEMDKVIRKKANGILIAINSALNNVLLNSDEESIRLFEHSFDETTETSLEENLELAKSAKEAEVLSINDRRRLIGKEPVEGGNRILLSIGQATMDINSGDITNINTIDVAKNNEVNKVKEDITA